MGVHPKLAAQNQANADAAKERRAQIWQYRILGYSQRKIARVMNLSPSTVNEHCKRAVQEFEAQTADFVQQWSTLMTERTEEIVAFQFQVMTNQKPPGWDKAHGPDSDDPREWEGYDVETRLSAARDLIKTLESLRKQLGIDAPEKHAVAVAAVDLRDVSGEELVRETGSLLAGLRTRSIDGVARDLEVERSNGSAAGHPGHQSAARGPTATDSPPATSEDQLTPERGPEDQDPGDNGRDGDTPVRSQG